MSTKETNPKDAVGVRKVPMSVVPCGVLMELALALLEGARKYGHHNYRRAGARASVYFDAAKRHLDAWWEGEDLDPDSRISHVTKAIASLTVLRDSMMTGNWTDDRPPPLPADWLKAMNARAAEIVSRFPQAEAPAVKAAPEAPANKACADCRFSLRSVIPGLPTCTHGERRHAADEVERGASGACGPEGKHWEPEVAPEAPVSKACADCWFFRLSTSPAEWGGCTHGGRVHFYARLERGEGGTYGACGPEGKHWRPKAGAGE